MLVCRLLNVRTLRLQRGIMGGSQSIIGTVFGQLTQAGEYGKDGYQKHSSSWDPKEMDVDLTGKHIFISGGSSGIGKQAALDLARKNGNIHIMCRNKEKGEAVRQELVEASGNTNISLHTLDVSSMESVRAFARNILESDIPVNALIHNAGALTVKRNETPEGNEQTLATHVLGPHLLTALLEDRLKSSENAHVIFVSSAGMYSVKMDLNNMQANKAYDGTMVYANNKRMQIYLMEMWAERLKGVVRVNAMHPGWTVTPGLDSLFEDKPMYKKFESSFRSVEGGADTIVWMTVAEKLKKTTGKFFFDRAEAKTHVRLACTQSSTSEQKKLWNACCELTGWKEGVQA